MRRLCAVWCDDQLMQSWYAPQGPETQALCVCAYTPNAVDLCANLCAVTCDKNILSGYAPGVRGSARRYAPWGGLHGAFLMQRRV